MGAVPPIAPSGPAIPPAPVLPAGPPSWRELFASADRMFIEPAVNYGTLSIALASADAPNILLVESHAGTGAHKRSGLQVPTAQVLPTVLRATCEGWARMEVERILTGL